VQRAAAPGPVRLNVSALFSNTHLASVALLSVPAGPLACHSSTIGALATSGRSNGPLSSWLRRCSTTLPTSVPPETRALRVILRPRYVVPPAL
jgi:hypothetical protein